jgi:hypothetical protein
VRVLKRKQQSLNKSSVLTPPMEAIKEGQNQAIEDSTSKDA